MCSRLFVLIRGWNTLVLRCRLAVVCGIIALSAAQSAHAQNMFVLDAYASDGDGNEITPEAGELFYVTVIFRYLNPTCDEYVIRRTVDGVTVDADPIDWGCGFGGATTWAHVWGGWNPCEAGTYNATVTLDVLNGVSETNESDNTFNFQINVDPLSGGPFVNMLGADAFYDNGYFGNGVIVGILDRGWIDTTTCGLDAPGKVTEFIRWVGLPDPGLNYPEGHETAVGAQATADRNDYAQGMAPGTEVWSAGVFTHEGFPWITSKNPPFYGLMVFGRLGIGSRTAHVLNNSWNWNHALPWTFDGSTHVTYAADAIALDGAIVVVAANNFTRRPEPPSDGWNVITVGATGPGPLVYDEITDFSNRGPSPSFFDLPAGDTRSTIDIVAPGINTPWGGGTSLAAPLVSGGAALLVDKGLDRGYSIDPRVIKSVLLNSAQPLPGWTNNASQVGPTWTTIQPMDFEQGAGQMFLTDAYDQYDSPAQQGVVSAVGWDLGAVSAGMPTDYRFATPLQGGTAFVATLVWFMKRDVLNYDPEAADPYAASSLVDQSFDNLDLELWSTDGLGVPQILVADSKSEVDSVEHIRFQVPSTGTYMLRVLWSDEVFDNIADMDEEIFALAWSGTSISLDPPTALDAVCFNGNMPTATPCGTNADCPVGQACRLKSRFLSINPADTAAAATPTALQVTVISVPNAPGAVNAAPYNYPAMVNDVWWVGAATNRVNDQSPYITAPLECTGAPLIQDWNAVGNLHIYGDAIVPGASYEIRSCASASGPCSAPLVLATTLHGDTRDAYNLTNFADISALVTEFSTPNAPSSLLKSHAWITPSDMTTTMGAPYGFNQISAGVTAFSGGAPPAPTPGANQCP